MLSECPPSQKKRARTRSFGWPGLVLALVIPGVITAQETSESLQQTPASWNESPTAVYREFRRSVANKDWRAQFECYVPKAQALMAYRLVLCGLLLEFETDLYLEIEQVLESHGIPDSTLTPYWPGPVHRIIDLQHAEEREQWQQAFLARLERWESEVMPKIRDCPALVAALQPLLEAAAQRHPDSTVARQIAFLSRYAYGRMRDLRIDADRADASIRIKLTDGAFVQAEPLERAAGLSDDGLADNPQVIANLLLVDPNAYGDLWTFARIIQKLTKATPHPQLVVIGMGTGDLAVELGLNEFTIEGEEEQRYTIQPFAGEEQEMDLAGTGVQTVRTSEVHFHKIEGGWRIAEIGK